MSSTVCILPGLFAHPSGALWIPDLGTALIADVHLGFSWAQRRRGELGPLVDSRTREKLLGVVDELEPRRLVFVGDLVHAPRPCEPERIWTEHLLIELSRRTELVAIRGNHDRAFSKEFAHLPVQSAESWSAGSIVALHGDRLPEHTLANQTLILGHLHPALPVIDAAGAGQKLPVFLVTKCCMVLPAFSPFAGGYDLLCGVPPEIAAFFEGEDVQTYATSKSRVVPLGSLRRAIERMLEADRGSAKQFRRRA